MAERTNQRYRRSYKNFLLNRRLQLRYALWVTGVSAAIAATLGFLIYEQSTFASSQIIAGFNATGMGWVDPQIQEQVRRELASSDLGLAATMLGFGLALALVLMASLIVMTHRVAGPLLRMARYFDQIAAGDLPTVGQLRSGDQFKELFTTLSTTLAVLRKREADDTEVVKAFMDACARADGTRHQDLLAAVAELRRAQSSACSRANH